LDPDRWVAHNLPHWTTPERSAARYELRPGVLRLRIDADQPAWRLDDGELRVSIHAVHRARRSRPPREPGSDRFEFPEGTDRDAAAYPKTGEVRAVRGYRRAGAGARAQPDD
jgi:hypothetical protein